LLDIAEHVGGELERLVEQESRPHAVAAALARDLGARRPAVVVFEDLHWADEATLDVLRLLGRKVEPLRALVLATYRDDEIDAAHPMQLVLGELATRPAVERLTLEPLSLAAVGELAEPHGVDAAELHRQTAGNPFYVTEVLATGVGEIPATVRDAVLARSARLGAPARRLLEAVAVVPQRVELWLLEQLAGEDAAHLEECLASGMLAAEHDTVGFRHELARLAVEEVIAPDRRRELHRRAVAALARAAAGALELPRLAHHADAAGDAEGVLRYAPEAGERAASLGAHREAAAQFARALRFANRLAGEERAALLERRSYECYLTHQIGEAIEARLAALECRRAGGDRLGEGDSFRWLSRLYWFEARNAEAEEAAQQAVALLEALPPGKELAMAYSNVAQLRMLEDDVEAAVEWGARAIEIAERLGEIEIQAHALNNVGTAELAAGLDSGRDKLERSLALALEAGLEEHVARAYTNLSSQYLRERRYDRADAYLAEGIAYSAERDLDSWRLYLIASWVSSELEQGRWTEAADSAREVLRHLHTAPVTTITALMVLGLVRARRGDPEVWPPLDQAKAIAEPTGELQRIGPVAAARAEAALLEGRPEAVAPETEAAFKLAIDRGLAFTIGELALLRRRAGIVEPVPAAAAEPYALELAGEYRQAAAAWTAIGCPYDAALALGESDDDDDLRRSLAELQRLGAGPASAMVARRLRERGARGVIRGPRPSTRVNPGGLTTRELEVAGLVAQGLRNGEIAARLFLSEKTVNHHVSAILRKLGVRTRSEASAEAVRLGIAGQDR
jgi:DNA-binding CsgD family transcriptional regulator